MQAKLDLWKAGQIELGSLQAFPKIAHFSPCNSVHSSKYSVVNSYMGKKKAGFHRPMPLEAYRTYSDLGGELYIRHIEYRHGVAFSLAPKLPAFNRSLQRQFRLKGLFCTFFPAER